MRIKVKADDKFVVRKFFGSLKHAKAWPPVRNNYAVFFRRDLPSRRRSKKGLLKGEAAPIVCDLNESDAKHQKEHLAAMALCAKKSRRAIMHVGEVPVSNSKGGRAMVVARTRSKRKKVTRKKKVTAAPRKRSEGSVAGKSVGKSSELGTTATWNKLLDDNFKKKLTDVQLSTAFDKEFPKRDKVQKVNLVRSWYNNGRYGHGPQGHLSKAQLEDGKRPKQEVALKGDKRSIAYDKKGESAGRAAPAKKPVKKKKTARKKK